ncbi:hypothetical protein IAE33_003193 [Pseudomonas sp. S60]|uniref:hypothetical protein n=1 Tax=unclassified Pseudomonas TaxID=196821 RepID=UPI001914779C|nr:MULTISPECIES: hypothetical protein [unclassified Pseudomonas]MBK5005403.1 hypothetical protein [Pseudomonas sp. S32]MBK5011333.1 hypothetical protein [Pseudomonas sp. S60]
MNSPLPLNKLQEQFKENVQRFWADLTKAEGHSPSADILTETVKTQVRLKRGDKIIQYTSAKGAFHALASDKTALLTCVYDDQLPVNKEGDLPALQILFRNLRSGRADVTTSPNADIMVALGWGQWFREKYGFAFVYFDQAQQGTADVKFEPSEDNIGDSRKSIIKVSATFDLVGHPSKEKVSIDVNAEGKLIFINE